MELATEFRSFERRAADSDLPVRLGRGVAVSTALLLAGFALLLAFRRLSGDLERPLSSGSLLVVGVALAIATSWVKLLARRTSRDDIGRRLLWSREISTGAVLLTGVALSLGGTSAAALTVFWALLIAVEVAPRFGRRWLFPTTVRPTIGAVKPPRVIADRAPHVEPPSAVEHLSDLQRLTRRRSAAGADVLDGWCQVDFAVAQRSATVHASFCPPFDRVPQLEFELSDAPDARVKVGQLLPYGVRFDVRLNEPPDEPVSLALEFVARCDD